MAHRIMERPNTEINLCHYFWSDEGATLNDSPQPQASTMFGFLNTNLELIRSSCQSISLPMIENRALLSINTLTSSCWTTSSNFPGWCTYSRWYCIPAQPLLRTPMRMSCGVGPEMRAWSRWTAVGVNVKAAFLDRIRGAWCCCLGAFGGSGATRSVSEIREDG